MIEAEAPPPATERPSGEPGANGSYAMLRAWEWLAMRLPRPMGLPVGEALMRLQR